MMHLSHDLDPSRSRDIIPDINFEPQGYKPL